MNNKKKIAYFDGGCKKNPGTVGSYGFIICQPWIEKKDVIRGKRITNNVAEYKGLLNVLKELHKLQLTGYTIHGDSQMVVKIVNKLWGNHKGSWNPHRKNKDLHDLAIKCRNLLEKGNHKLTWIPREENVMADELCDRAYQEV
jgi:ribonuclease HI